MKIVINFGNYVNRFMWQVSSKDWIPFKQQSYRRKLTNGNFVIKADWFEQLLVFAKCIEVCPTKFIRSKPEAVFQWHFFFAEAFCNFVFFLLLFIIHFSWSSVLLAINLHFIYFRVINLEITDVLLLIWLPGGNRL